MGNHSTSKLKVKKQMFKSVFAATAALSVSAGAAFAGLMSMSKQTPVGLVLNMAVLRLIFT